MNNTQQATEVWTVPGWDEELRCEARHLDPYYPCSVRVTHLMDHCITPEGKLVCSKTAEYVSEAKNVQGICEGCRLPVADCWTVRPI